MSFHDLTGQILGDYELLELIGEGGMGAVYRAREIELGREVAFKVILKARDFDKTTIERFNREARTAASLDHMHIIPIFRHGTIGDITYVTMRLLRGGSLSDRINERADKPLTLHEATELLRQLAGALDYANKRGIIHRDIKAGNVMFDEEGMAYLVDFGIAKVVDETTNVNLTEPGAVIGTFSHMAPELWDGKPASPASDQYALGIMLYQILTGKVPFEGTSAVELIKSHITKMPVPVHHHRKDIPMAITEVIEKAIAKKPEDRYASATEFYEAFKAAAQEAGEETGNLDLFTRKISLKPYMPAQPAAPGDATSTPAPGGRDRYATAGVEDPTTHGTIPPAARTEADAHYGESEARTLTQTLLYRTRSNPLIAILAVIILLAGVAVLYIALQPEDKLESDTPILEPLRSLTARSGPGAQYDTVADLTTGEHYDIVGISEDGNWYQIILADGSRGWVAVSSTMVRTAGPLNEVAIVQLPTDTPTPTNTPTDTPMPTATDTPSEIPTDTPSHTPSDTPTDTPTNTNTPSYTPSDTPTDTPTNTATPTDTPTLTDTPTHTPTDTLTSTPTDTEIPTDTPTPTFTLTPSETAPPTFTPTPTEIAAPDLALRPTDGTITVLGSTTFRSGAGDTFDEITTLDAGTFPVRRVITQPEIWYEVDLGGQIAWVSDASPNIVPKGISLEEGGPPDAQEIAFGQTIDTELVPNSETQFFFRGQAGQVISIAVLDAQFDGRMELYNVDITLPLIQDDDSGGNLNPLINGYTLQADGVYQIVIRGYGATDQGAFRITLVEGVLEVESAVGNTITYGQTITAPLTSNEEARYTFKGTEGDVISIIVQAGFDTFVEVENESDRVIVSDDDSGSMNPLIEFFELPNTGEYEIVLRGYSASSVGTYSLTLLKSFTQDTTPISYGQTLNGRINPLESVAFTFVGTQNERVTIAVDSGFDAALALRDSFGRIIVEDDDSGGELQPLIEGFTLPSSGNFIIVVTGFSEQDAGEFTITLTVE